MMKRYMKKPLIIEAEQLTEETYIDTLEGTMKANAGDWLIKGVNGELYPCKDEIFRKSYVPMDGEEKGFSDEPFIYVTKDENGNGIMRERTMDGELKQRFLSLIVTVFALSMILDGMGFHDVFRFLESATRHGIIDAFQRVSEREKANEYSGSVHDFRQTKKGKR